MICVCIGRGRHKHMMAEHRYLAEDGVKLVELRADYITSRLNVKRLLQERPCPAIFTCRREQDGGQWAGTEEERQTALRTAIAEGVDYVDLEEDIADKIPRFGKTKRIVSYHNFRDTPEDLEAIHKRMAACDADIVKLATMTYRPSDNLRMLRLIRDAKIPTVGICMGEIGMPTRILAARFGAPFTYATFHRDRKLAPGQIAYTQMRDSYAYESINEETEVYGVVADPIASNLAPVVHNAAFRQFGMNRVYVPFRVPRDELEEFFLDCEDLGVKGLTINPPHKDEALRHMTKVDGAVRGIGAANTALIQGRAIVGYNTDHRGFLDCLDAIHTDEDLSKHLSRRTALVLGAGSVAKAIAYALRKREADVVIASRTYERSLLLAESLRCRAVQWYERQKAEVDIVINATPVGMHPNVDETPYDRKYIPRGIIVVDTVFNPEQTLLIKQAREQNCRVITGVDLFIRQAALQFEYFTGLQPEEELMRDVLKRSIGAAKYE